MTGWGYGFCALLLTATFAADRSFAQSEASPGDLLFQLNNAETKAGDCQLTFAIKNNTGVDISKGASSMAIVDQGGRVNAIVTFEFLKLPLGRTKIFQFALAERSCEDIAGLTINEFVECTDIEGQPSPLCEAKLLASSLTEIDFPWQID